MSRRDANVVYRSELLSGLDIDEKNITTLKSW